jgi:hypothetical protein
LDPADATVTGPINLLGKTFFKNLRVFIGGHMVYEANNLYAFRAFLETELSCGQDAKASYLQAALYDADDPPNGIDTANNLALLRRGRPFKQHRVVELIAPLHCDLFSQERYLPDEMDMRLELTRNTDQFALMSFEANAAYRIVVHNMTWHVRKVQLAASLHLACQQQLLHHPAKFPVRRVQLTNLHVADGRRVSPQHTLFTGQIPRRLVLAMVDTDAFHGTYTKSPFNFKHYNIEQASITAGGQQFPPTPLTCDFNHGRYIHAFINMFEALNMANENRGNCITRERFGQGSTVLAFDLTPDTNDGQHWELVKDGTTSLNLVFRNPIPAPGIEVIVYAEYDSMVSIDRNRQPSFDYTA